MSLTRYPLAASVVNQVALEVGLPSVQDPYASTDPAYLQLCGLLNTAGRELAKMRNWQTLVQSFVLVTAPGDTGVYALPTDFGSLIDQSAWNRSAHVPVGGPLSEQTWEYLQGRGILGTQTIYAQFRIAQGQLWLWPQPPVVGQTIGFEYRSRGWIKPTGWTAGNAYADAVSSPADSILFDPYLIERALKLKFLVAKGFDSAKAQEEFGIAWESETGADKGAPILSLNSGRRSPSSYLIDPVRNVPETGIGR